ncbi:MAG: L,D-transpeptidase [Cellulosilyticaceae bacterium]
MKKSNIVSILLIACILGQSWYITSYANEIKPVENTNQTEVAKINKFDQTIVGKLAEGTVNVYFENQIIPTVKVGNTHYVDIRYFKDGNITASESEVNKSFYISSNVGAGVQSTISLKTDKNTYIPLRSLSENFTLVFNDKDCIVTRKEVTPSNYITMTNNSITNTYDQTISLKLTLFSWDGQAIVQTEHNIEEIAPNEVVNIPIVSESVVTYGNVVNTIIIKQNNEDEEVEENINETVLTVNAQQFGQTDELVFKAYEKAKNYLSKDYLNELFPETFLMGTIKYDTKGLKKGEKVRLWSSDKNTTRTVMHNNKKVQIPYGALEVPGNPKVNSSLPNNEEIEAYVKQSGWDSKTKYLVWTDLSRQATYVLEKKQGEWKVIRKMLSITGTNKTPTPFGKFELTKKVPSFGQNKGYMCKNAFGFIGTTYLYHSLVYDITGKYLQGGQVLGQRASNGCIRLKPEDSEWFYKTMTSKTQVIIR